MSALTPGKGRPTPKRKAARAAAVRRCQRCQVPDSERLRSGQPWCPVPRQAEPAPELPPLDPDGMGAALEAEYAAAKPVVEIAARKNGKNTRRKKAADALGDSTEPAVVPDLAG